MATDLEKAVTRDDIDGKGLKIGIVQSRFNQEIGNALLSACKSQLLLSQVDEKDITVMTVPGALESPLMLHEMALTGSFDGLIALGCIIRGDTYHFEIVANESARCISDIQIETGIPIANAILTTENEEQAIARMTIKGTEAAQVVMEMIQALKSLGRN
ncbi:6,7-dimethyl-8-ribityllumazine synthase [Methylophaga thiooxydans]|uniref:6,7-dimethyl-8-ribityllumazine synthase n=1 Tax=Methylophaga thiooxydans DMS010 TaxID=637616 RepID=C0N1Q3_9GAMM|nr:6,7-dimethyl-8-ribityllumazine synthase [Methylophaga thiooxydans]EEF81304.1 6,7-dimethyl-8-ribityllumazine synthase [Methylophaga thiooxydans DMS010]